MITSIPATSTTMPWNIPNTLTWLRIATVPLIVVLFYAPYPWADPAAGLLFAAAGITDSLDGYLARRLGQTSRLGTFLDPVADKLIVAVALLLAPAFPPVARAGSLTTEVVGIFPRDAAQFAFADLRQARSLAWFPELQKEVLPNQLQQFEQFLASSDAQRVG